MSTIVGGECPSAMAMINVIGRFGTPDDLARAQAALDGHLSFVKAVNSGISGLRPRAVRRAVELSEEAMSLVLRESVDRLAGASAGSAE